MTADCPSASDLAAQLAQRRADWLSAYFPAGKLRGGVFELGDADGAAGRSFPIPLRGHPGLVDFGGGFAGDDLALLARAIGAGDDMAAAYEEALAYLGLPSGTATRPPPPPRPTPAPDQDHLNRKRAQEFWRQTESIPDGGLAFDYLTKRRGIATWDDDRVRWHPACPGRERVGCIVAPVVCHRTRYTVAVWRIWPSMTEPMAERRRGLGPTKHNFSPTWVADGDEIALTEGVEDALAFHQMTGVPTWSALSAKFMAELILPARFRRVVIVQDNDAPDRNGRRPGPEGAQKLARRLRDEGREVEITSAVGAKDPNELLIMRTVG